MSVLDETADRSVMEELRDKHLDTMIALAFMQQDALEAQQLETEEEGFSVDPDRARRALDRALERREQELRGEKLRARGERRTLLPRRVSLAVRILAGVFVLLSIALPVTAMNVESVRVSVMKLFLNVDEKRHRIGITLGEDPEASFDVPTEWEGMFWPSVKPEGFALKKLERDPLRVEFANRSGESFLFEEHFADTDRILLDGKAEYLPGEINGADLFLIRGKDGITLIWSTEERYFILRGSLEREEAVQVARNVKRVILSEAGRR